MKPNAKIDAMFDQLARRMLNNGCNCGTCAHCHDFLDCIADELAPIKRIVTAAYHSVHNPVWAGVCDEDVELEEVLRDAGFDR